MKNKKNKNVLTEREIEKNKFIEDFNNGIEMIHDMGTEQSIMSPVTGEFCGTSWESPMNYKKKELIMNAVSKNIPIRAWNVFRVPYESLVLIYDSYIRAVYAENYIDDIDMFKLTHSRLVLYPDKTAAWIRSMFHGINILDEIENVNDYSVEILNLVADYSSNGINICNRIVPGVTVDQLRNIRK